MTRFLDVFGVGLGAGGIPSRGLSSRLATLQIARSDILRIAEALDVIAAVGMLFPVPRSCSPSPPSSSAAVSMPTRREWAPLQKAAHATAHGHCEASGSGARCLKTSCSMPLDPPLRQINTGLVGKPAREHAVFAVLLEHALHCKQVTVA